jgi:hypothetical protein
MLLPFSDGLIQVGKHDSESCSLADRHYSRQTVGSNQFMPPGRTMVLRNAEGTIVWGWLWQDKRDDGQRGYNCSIFRNESHRLSSEVILEAERAAWGYWGPNRLFTYIDPTKTRSIMRRGKRCVGFCYRKAGWKPLVHKDGTPCTSKAGLHILVKLWHPPAH